MSDGEVYNFSESLQMTAYYRQEKRLYQDPHNYPLLASLVMILLLMQ